MTYLSLCLEMTENKKIRFNKYLLRQELIKHWNVSKALIPAWISNHINYKVWEQIAYPSNNFNDVALKFGNG